MCILDWKLHSNVIILSVLRWSVSALLFPLPFAMHTHAFSSASFDTIPFLQRTCFCARHGKRCVASVITCCCCCRASFVFFFASIYVHNRKSTRIVDKLFMILRTFFRNWVVEDAFRFCGFMSLTGWLAGRFICSFRLMHFRRSRPNIESTLLTSDWNIYSFSWHPVHCWVCRFFLSSVASLLRFVACSHTSSQKQSIRFCYLEILCAI